jgi:hypothetical protein
MGTQNRIALTSPPLRLLMGSLYVPQTTDGEGKPRIIKSGPNAGQPNPQYFFAGGIPKRGENAWWETDWGRQILAVAQKCWPNGQTQMPTFAWKIVDGDSHTPNKKGITPASREGYPGHWVLSFGSQFAPKIYNADGSAALLEVDAVKIGYWVQVQFSVDGNESVQNPGIYLNHNMVSLQGYDKVITMGPDPKAAGFGAAALPAHVSKTPVGGFAPPAVPGATPPAAAATVPPPAASAPPVPVQPSASFLGGPPPVPGAYPGGQGPSATPPPPGAGAAAPPPPVGPQMTAKATNSYAQYIAAGWTDAQLRVSGLMV